jgi:hypothetical protein
LSNGSRHAMGVSSSLGNKRAAQRRNLDGQP